LNPTRCGNFHGAVATSLVFRAGGDSVALLHWLVDLGYRELIVCHLDHQLRGRSSQADARFREKAGH